MSNFTIGKHALPALLVAAFVKTSCADVITIIEPFPTSMGPATISGQGQEYITYGPEVLCLAADGTNCFTAYVPHTSTYASTVENAYNSLGIKTFVPISRWDQPFTFNAQSAASVQTSTIVTSPGTYTMYNQPTYIPQADAISPVIISYQLPMVSYYVQAYNQYVAQPISQTINIKECTYTSPMNRICAVFATYITIEYNYVPYPAIQTTVVPVTTAQYCPKPTTIIIGSGVTIISGGDSIQIIGGGSINSGGVVIGPEIGPTSGDGPGSSPLNGSGGEDGGADVDPVSGSGDVTISIIYPTSIVYVTSGTETVTATKTSTKTSTKISTATETLTQTDFLTTETSTETATSTEPVITASVVAGPFLLTVDISGTNLKKRAFEDYAGHGLTKRHTHVNRQQSGGTGYLRISDTNGAAIVETSCLVEETSLFEFDTDGQLTYNNLFAYASNDEIAKGVAPLYFRTSGDISESFSIIGDALTWTNDAFADDNSTATFCLANSTVFVVYNSNDQPLDCVNITINVYTDTSCAEDTTSATSATSSLNSVASSDASAASSASSLVSSLRTQTTSPASNSASTTGSTGTIHVSTDISTNLRTTSSASSLPTTSPTTSNPSSSSLANQSPSRMNTNTSSQTSNISSQASKTSSQASKTSSQASNTSSQVSNTSSQASNTSSNNSSSTTSPSASMSSSNTATISGTTTVVVTITTTTSNASIMSTGITTSTSTSNLISTSSSTSTHITSSASA